MISEYTNNILTYLCNARHSYAKKGEDILTDIVGVNILLPSGVYYNSYYRSQEQRAGYCLVRRLLSVNITDSNK